MRYTDHEREQVQAAAERAWLDVVANYETGRDAFIRARLDDLAERRFLEATLPRCADCGAHGPHAHPITLDDELGALLDGPR